ncbi:SWIM-type domain-containing protein [Aphis craccivora]|uniref:SWIM-type domain-containing protein n=1 Tax=Aphis craccivora TaxID=307492 RepID=A0A6G0ZI20_APHCR|nr:SWIM-type domain-containing protein [Aphis craccivora]
MTIHYIVTNLDQSSAKINAINYIWLNSSTLLCVILYSGSIIDAEHAYLKPKWCLCFRDHIISRGHVTNKYCEVAVRLFKDCVLCMRIFQTVEMHRPDYFYKKYLKTYLKSDDEFLVPSEEESGLMYYVDTNIITPADRFNIAKIVHRDKVIDESFYEPFINENNGLINK